MATTEIETDEASINIGNSNNININNKNRARNKLPSKPVQTPAHHRATIANQNHPYIYQHHRQNDQALYEFIHSRLLTYSYPPIPLRGIGCLTNNLASLGCYSSVL